MKVYKISGDPVALARPRVGSHKVYDSQAQLKLVAGLELASQHEVEIITNKPLHLDVVFFMPMPAGMTPEKKEAKRGTHHIYRPDLDNLIKWIADIAAGIIYNDDCTIASITSKKIYDINPRTEFTVKELS